MCDTGKSVCNTENNQGVRDRKKKQVCAIHGEKVFAILETIRVCKTGKKKKSVCAIHGKKNITVCHTGKIRLYVLQGSEDS